MNEKNINIQIEINGSNKLSALASSIDTLKESVNNLNKEFTQYNKHNQEANNWGSKIKSMVKDLSENFKMFKEIIQGTSKNLGNFANIYSGIFTLVTTYGPAIIDFLGEMFQSDKIKASAQALKDYKEIMDDYVDKVSKDTSKAQLFLNIASNEKQAHGTRIEAVKQLNNLAPDYLKYLTLENLKTKEGRALIDEYIKSLRRKAIEESAQEKRADYVKQRNILKSSLDIAKKNYWDYQTGRKKDETYSTTDGVPGNLGGTVRIGSRKKDAENYYEALLKEDGALLKSIKRVDDSISTELGKYAPKEILKRPQKLPSENHKPNSPIPVAQNLEAKGITVDNALKQDKKTYEEEMAVLNRHLEMKLISQEDYQHKSEETRNKYLLGIGAAIKTFQKNELTDTQKHLEDVINAESIVKQGNEAKKKAWTPDQKFEAEKLRIEGQYATELANFKGTEDAKKALAEKGQQEITALTQSYEQQRRDFAMQAAQQVSDAAFSILKNGMQVQSAARLKTLDTQKSAELNNYIIIACISAWFF